MVVMFRKHCVDVSICTTCSVHDSIRSILKTMKGSNSFLESDSSRSFGFFKNEADALCGLMNDTGGESHGKSSGFHGISAHM